MVDKSIFALSCKLPELPFVTCPTLGSYYLGSVHFKSVGGGRKTGGEASEIRTAFRGGGGHVNSACVAKSL